MCTQIGSFLGRAPIVAENIQIYGLLYDVDDGSLREVVKTEAHELDPVHKKAEVGRSLS